MYNLFISVKNKDGFILYNTKYYKVQRIDLTDSYRLCVKYTSKKEGEELKILDILDSHEFKIISFKKMLK